jgi:hypothetical protein
MDNVQNYDSYDDSQSLAEGPKGRVAMLLQSLHN